MPQQSLLPVIAVWVVVFGLFYFLLMRPQKKRDKQLKEMLKLMMTTYLLK